MRIIFLVNSFPSGGAEKQTYILCKEAIRRGHEASIYSLRGTETYEYNGVRIVCLDCEMAFSNTKSRFSRFLRRIPANRVLLKNFADSRADVIVAYLPFFVVPLAMMRKKLRVYSIRGFHNKYFKFPFKYFLKRIDLVTTNNFPSYHQCISNRINSVLINNASSSEQQSNNLDNHDILLNNSKKFLIVANISKPKNIEVVLKAFLLLKNDGYSLRIAGKTNNEYALELKAKYERKEGNIFFLGHLDEIALHREYEHAECIIHPSLREGTPNSILEAMKICKPILVSRIPEHVYLVDNNNDLLFNPYSERDLVDKITTLDISINREDPSLIELLNYLSLKIKINYSHANATLFLDLLEKSYKEKMKSRDQL